jgi:hypothetical protein
MTTTRHKWLLYEPRLKPIGGKPSSLMFQRSSVLSSLHKRKKNPTEARFITPPPPHSHSHHRFHKYSLLTFPTVPKASGNNGQSVDTRKTTERVQQIATLMDARSSFTGVYKEEQAALRKKGIRRSRACLPARSRSSRSATRTHQMVCTPVVRRRHVH